MTSPLSKEQAQALDQWFSMNLQYLVDGVKAPPKTLAALQCIYSGEHAVYDTATHAAVPWSVIRRVTGVGARTGDAADRGEGVTTELSALRAREERLRELATAWRFGEDTCMSDMASQCAEELESILNEGKT